MGLASIVICAYNQLSDCSIPCLSSVVEHTKYPHELIPVSDGSTDGTCEYFRGISPKAVCLLKNRGPGVARNRGMALAAGDLIVFLDNDVVVHDRWLTNLAGIMKRRRVDILAPILTNETRKLNFPRSKDGLIDVREAASACMLVSRSLLENIGIMDEALSYAGEDTDLCLRAKGAGFRVAITPDVMIEHNAHSTLTQAITNRGRQQFDRKWNQFGVRYTYQLPK